MMLFSNMYRACGMALQWLDRSIFTAAIGHQ